MQTQNSAGFIDASLIGSQNALNFAYIVYLKLRSMQTNDVEIESVAGGEQKYGGICGIDLLKVNLSENDVPEMIFDGAAENYEEFTGQRRLLMASKLKNYYQTL